MLLTNENVLFRLPSLHAMTSLSIVSGGVLSGFAYDNECCFFYSWRVRGEKCTAFVYQVEK